MKGSTYKPKAEKYLLSAACPFCEPKLFDASLKTTPKPVLCDYHSHNIATDIPLPNSPIRARFTIFG